MQPLSICLEHISKTFVHSVKGRVTAVDDVVLEVVPGELLTLLGPSGCGKTSDRLTLTSLSRRVEK